MIISIKDLTVKYRSATVLDNISFDVAEGDYIGIVGPNGSGKTTLVKTILGLVDKEKGDIILCQTPIESFRDWQHVGYLPQITTIEKKGFPATVHEIVASGLLSKKRFPKCITKKDKQRVDEVLELLTISQLKKRPIDKLSGGQRQRVLLARAMVSDPKLLILDEPTVALDPATRESFYQTLQQLNKQQGKTIMLITHDSSSIGSFATKMLYIDKRIVFYGNFEEFCKSESMTNYFGEYAQHLMCHQHNGGCCCESDS